MFVVALAPLSHITYFDIYLPRNKTEIKKVQTDLLDLYF